MVGTPTFGRFQAAQLQVVGSGEARVAGPSYIGSQSRITRRSLNRNGGPLTIRGRKSLETCGL
eukprot:12173232-Alexandrium_andersonii.AAC.1